MRERDCFYYIIVQTYDVGLHSRRHPMEFDAGTRPFAAFDAPKWTFGQIIVVAGRRGALVEVNFYNKLERLSEQAGKRDKFLAAHVQCICKAHDIVITSSLQQIHGSSGADATTSRESVGEQGYVYKTLNLFVTSCWTQVKGGERLEWDKQSNGVTHWQNEQH